jgi:hypothetical protein
MIPEIDSKERALEPAFITIKAGCDFLAVSPAEMYRLLGLKKVEGVKAGKRTLLRVSSLKARAESLPPAKIKPPTRRKRKGP